MSANPVIEQLNALKLKPGQGAFCRLCQHSFILKLGKTTIYIDPYLTDDPRRLFRSPVAADEVTNAAAVLGTHDHRDHIDRPAWPVIAAASPRARFAAPRAVLSEGKALLDDEESDRLIGINAGESISVSGLKITAVPAAHEFLDYDSRTGLYPYLGYIIEGNGKTVYHAGDCCRYEGQVPVLRRWHLDAAFLPINGRDAWRYEHGCIGCMTYQEAADLAGEISPELTVPAHYDTFANNREDPRRFAEYMRAKYPELKTKVAAPGEIVLF